MDHCNYVEKILSPIIISRTSGAGGQKIPILSGRPLWMAPKITLFFNGPAMFKMAFLCHARRFLDPFASSYLDEAPPFHSRSGGNSK